MTKTLNDRLFDAINENDIKEVSKCLKEGAVVYATDSKGRRPLHLAYKSVAIAKLLIEHRADPNATDNEGLTPLHNACFYRGIEISKLLIEKGANINVADNKGLTPLHKACSRGRTDVAKLFIENGAKVNATDKGLIHTPLHKACLAEYTDIVKLLIENGANVNATDHRSPLYIASSFKRDEIVKLLISAILLENLGKKEKPEYIKQHQDFSAYWDEEVKKIKISFLQSKLDSKTLAEDIVYKISLLEKDTLLSLSCHQFFKLLYLEKTNELSKKADKSVNTAPSSSPN
ncbi:ankyrin repeat domain-containing protein [Rickettsiella endosymbiont of Rhagonycha lignosa]|uniref:ankyrin repeat domain-containing protein n=1 Tax=Rickettsiella endosymbiont of Rhagonycha lignosa TaxID=3077937 RepID=UPI00313C7E79